MKKTDLFVNRHIGPDCESISTICETIGIDNLDELIDQTVPETIRLREPLKLPEAMTEYEYEAHIRDLASENKTYKSFIGQGYYGTITPAAIRRNLFENPGWYTQYTPYQAEIAQGRLEGLLNFQTLVSDLTALEIANASLLDEATAAAEAMIMFFNHRNKRKILAPKFFVSDQCFEQTIELLKTRAEPLGIDLEIGEIAAFKPNDSYFGVLLQYPDRRGEILAYAELAEQCKSEKVAVTVAADLLSLALLTPPGEWGADCVIGNTQRFGVPLGYGGPHAAFFATKSEFKRVIPGRIIGISVDRLNNSALRMALQTREQHIRREKATSNICTAQALLAIISGMYAVYHGPEGIRSIAQQIHELTAFAADRLRQNGVKLCNSTFFDTLTIELSQSESESIRAIALKHQVNLRYDENGNVGFSFDQTCSLNDAHELLSIILSGLGKQYIAVEPNGMPVNEGIPDQLRRETDFLTHPVFKTNHTETRLMRYIKTLENKDLSLTQSMIPLGSCTMKLNAAAQLEPLSMPEFANIHPFVPVDQAAGYAQMINSLEIYLNAVTGFDATSLQPNSGAQGEFAGLMVIRAYHHDRGDFNRNVVLIPSSAHGTNPASAVMAGMKVVVVACDNHGNISIDDLKLKLDAHSENLSALMVTYPSTHGVFEHKIIAVCDLIHEHGGQVYMDGANMNAQVGLTSPAEIGADVCHLNLHKTFSIPHGGGGPGMGPICVKAHLAPFLPTNCHVKTGGTKAIPAISAAPWGSASILLISYGYIRLLGREGALASTKIAILNANYIKERLQEHYQVLYTGREHGRVAHELILDLRPFKHTIGVEVEDVAKRLIDYGFHAPTVSFPVAGTLMIEPTESEDLAELDRFCEAMIEIRNEIAEIERGVADATNNVLKNAPHVMVEVCGDDWNLPYSREKAAFPVAHLKGNKFWASVARVNNSHGDRNLICTCPPIEAYEEEIELIN